MAKTQEELNELKQKIEDLNRELSELSKEELNLVSGGLLIPYRGEINEDDILQTPVD